MKYLLILPLFVLLSACGGSSGSRGPIIGSVFAPAPATVTYVKPGRRPWYRGGGYYKRKGWRR